MDKPRIVWMVDESIANAKPKNWESVLRLEEELVGLIGNSSLSHQVLHPLTCIRSLVKKLEGKSFSCVIDLAGWLTPVFREILPDTKIFSDFSMSRVRKVSSPVLETTGYTVTMSPKEIRDESLLIDLSHPLIVDDVSFSGWTSRKTMEIWRMNPKETTHAFLIANIGDLGPKPGAVKGLEQIGSSVFFGEALTTPQEDGWHLKDLHMHQNLADAFEIALKAQEAFGKEGIESPKVRSLLEDREVIDILFPGSYESKQLQRLESEGKFLTLDRECLTDGAIHAKNPFLWVSPYFLSHVDSKKIKENRARIKEVLVDLRTLTADPEARTESGIELSREVQASLSLARGKERL